MNMLISAPLVSLIFAAYSYVLHQDTIFFWCWLHRETSHYFSMLQIGCHIMMMGQLHTYLTSIARLQRYLVWCLSRNAHQS